MKPEFHTLAEVADRLRVSVRTLEREIRDGKLSILRVRSRRLVAASELERYISAGEIRTCQSERSASAGKSESALAMVNALSERFLEAPQRQTRGSSKLRSAVRKSTLKLVAGQDT